MDSDEEDEDYVPGADPDERGAASDDDENDAADDGGRAPASLSITKRKAVDDAFFDLFGYHYYNAQPPTTTTTTTTTARGRKSKEDKLMPTKSQQRALSKRRSIVASIFGKRSCQKLMAHARANAALAGPKPGSRGGMLRLEKRVIVEVKRFAGQEIRVEKVVMVPVMADDDEASTDGGGADDARTTTDQAASAAHDAAATTSGSSTTARRNAKGVDNLLSELSRPDKLSTIAKTTADWDLFKAKNADATLKEELENKARGNEAYLVKKDFLSRVDNRKFELEKAGRDRERVKRGRR